MTAHTEDPARRTGDAARQSYPARRTGPHRRSAAACTALALALLSGFALAPAAHAGSGGDAAPERCTPGWVCGWTGPSYTGVVSLVAQDMPRFPETTAYVGFNDAASVWYGAASPGVGGAAGGRCVTLYNGPGYKGRALTLAPGKGVPRLPPSFGHVHSSRFHTCKPALP
ncbi:peptidase inhibitor family I36 protein [Streptomyces sp. NPDC058401]|uniref:peptidase inhibitor family I36 protein n=1 Tax=Streptomyces sp. NPDC058401 TaxID=3346480 RepID=UPI003650036B